MSDCYPLFGKHFDTTEYNSDKLLDLFLNSTVDGVAIVDMEGRFLRVNPKYSSIFGYSKNELLGRNYEEFSNLEKVRDFVEQVKAGKTFSNLNVQYNHKNGKILDIAVSYSPFRNTAGEIIAMIGIFRDITQQKNLERELKESRELYKLIAENTTDLINIVSNTKERTIIYASPSHEKIFGLSPSTIIGRSLSEFISKKESKMLKRKIVQWKNTRDPILFVREIKSKEGETLFFEYNISPIFNESGDIGSYLSVARNITERVKNESTIRNLDRLSITGQLAAGIAHEIRNPLTALKGFSKLLSKNTDIEKQGQYLDIIRGELDRIDMIVNEFMSLAKPQAAQYVKAGLLSIIESTISILQPQALLHNVQIKTILPTRDIELLCSPNQLKQVFVNFLKNAIEAMPDGGNVYIKVEHLNPSLVQITFTDEGIGIAPEIIGYLGTPFYTTKDKGIGLGLTVSNKIIQEHNGKMEIESQAGIGTTIRIELECLVT
ncbi:PAS domain-containing sensor histidine kinase [Bacillus sp. FJAT-27225]|uniref:PAS domain-containing sensor histidine kinase n=1 Tax=Bacillus sp. FJAT-27225 TaxID=1743144 RepID=UPI00080C28EA|nr:PAS domain S-box protein [Bacillus sp. FJAT-27225]OCA85946.1 PAS domain-containing sensor histidine kinase [Bacillus sp. FJAT-27225]